MSSSSDRILQQALQQRTLSESRCRVSSSLCSSPTSDSDSCYRDSQPSKRFWTGDVDATQPCSMESSSATGISASKPLGNGHKVRSLSMSEPHSKFFEDNSTPMMFYSDDALRDVCQKAVRRGPLSFLGCWWRKGRSTEQKEWADNRASALLEISRRQQNALAVKQDTIEMLEWKLEQLQMHGTETLIPAFPNSKSSSPRTTGGISQRFGSAVPSSPTGHVGLSTGSFRFSQPKTGSPGEVTRGSVSQRISKSSSIEDNDEDKVRQVVERTHNPQAEDQYLDFRTLKLQDTEQSAMIHLFERMVVRSRLCVRQFCKIFMKQMEISGYSLWRTLAEIERNSKFLKREHTAFVLESRLNKALFQSFETDSFDQTGLTKIIDPDKRCAIRFQEFQRMKALDSGTAVVQNSSYGPEFLSFCDNKIRDMWFLFPWNIVFKDGEERAAFTNSFIEAAKCVWMLHRLAFSFQPPATILRVGSGMEANNLYVEQVTAIDEGCKKCGVPKVEFMTMPGFFIHNKIIKCQVYRHLRCR